MPTPLVSVIIPAYNAEATIGDTLASVLAQTYAALEVIVVDDGSQDRTAEVVEAVAARDERVRLLRQSNRGVAAARNLAIEHARGEYVAPLDADDVWCPEKLALQVRRMEEGGEEMGMVYSWWVRINEEGEREGWSTPWEVEGEVYETLVYVNFIGNASVPLFRRSALDRVGTYDPGLRARGGQGCEDWDITLRVAEEYKVGVAPGYLVEYRSVPGSMSFDCATMAKSYDLVVEGLRQKHPDKPARVFRWSRARFYTYLAHMSHATARYPDALYWACRAIRLDLATALSSYTLRLALRSLLRVALDPLTARLASLRGVADSVSAEVGRRDGALGGDHAEASGGGTLPWQSWKPYDRVHKRRWRFIRERDTGRLCLL